MQRFSKLFIASEANNYHPLVLRHGFLFALTIAMILVRVFVFTEPVASSAVDSSTLMQLINQERVNRNLTSLTSHPSLIQAATNKSSDMIERDYFAHINPDGEYVWGEIIAAGYKPYKILGENLAIDFTTSEGMVQAWIDSPTHRDNLLNAEFVHQGLNASYGDFEGRYTNVTTSLFGTLVGSPQTQPAPQAPEPEIETQPEPKPQTHSETPKSPEIKPTTPQIENEISLPPQTETSPEVPEQTEQESTPEQSNEPTKNTQTNDEPENQFNYSPNFATSQEQDFNLIKLVFTAFGIGFLAVLAIDSVIIYRNQAKLERSHPSYHLFIFVLLIIVVLVVWWWS